MVVDDGTVLWGRRAAQPLPNASTTKMATALVVVQKAELDDVVRVSEAAAATGGGGLDLQPGDEFALDALLEALLLTSSNDAAVALAEHVAGSETAFVALANDYVRRLGAESTNFVTAHGLDQPGHVASARDLALIGMRLLRDPTLAAIVAEPRLVIAGPRGSIELENRNPLLETYPGAVGIKTGFTAGAGEVLVAAARRRGRVVVSVAMRSADPAGDSSALLDYGFARLRNTVLLRARRPAGELVLDPGGSAAVVPARSIRGIAPAGRVVVRFIPDELLRGPIEAGERVGRIELFARARLIASVPALAADDVDSNAPDWPAQALGGLLRAAHSLSDAVGLS